MATHQAVRFCIAPKLSQKRAVIVLVNISRLLKIKGLYLGLTKTNVYNATLMQTLQEVGIRIIQETLRLCNQGLVMFLCMPTAQSYFVVNYKQR